MPKGLAALIAAATNCPPIEALLLSIQLGEAEPSLYEFRYQEDCFFARAIVQRDPKAPFNPRDPAAGRWQQEFWSWEPDPPRLPVLDTYVFRESDTNSNAYLRQRQFERVFSLYATFGIAANGIGQLRLTNDCLLSTEAYSGWLTKACISDFIVSNDLPVQAKTRRTGEHPHATETLLKYKYDSGRAPFPYPAEITASSVFNGKEEFSSRLAVVEMKLGDQFQPMPRERFIPDTKAWPSNFIHLTYTNGANFMVRGKRLVSMKGTVEEERIQLLGAAQGRRNWVLTILVITLLSLPLLVAIKRKRST